MFNSKQLFKIGDEFFVINSGGLSSWFKVVKEAVTSVTETRNGWEYNNGLLAHNMYIDFDSAKKEARRRAKESYERNCEQIDKQQEPKVR